MWLLQDLSWFVVARVCCYSSCQSTPFYRPNEPTWRGPSYRMKWRPHSHPPLSYSPRHSWLCLPSTWTCPPTSTCSHCSAYYRSAFVDDFAALRNVVAGNIPGTLSRKTPEFFSVFPLVNFDQKLMSTVRNQQQIIEWLSVSITLIIVGAGLILNSYALVGLMNSLNLNLASYSSRHTGHGCHSFGKSRSFQH